MLEKFFPTHKINGIKHSLPCNPATFLKLGCAKTDAERDKVANLPYMQIIGSLLYVSCMTRPDIAYYMSVLCKFMSDPSPDCFEAAMSLLLYVGHTKHKGISFDGSCEAMPGLRDKDSSAMITSNMGFQAFSDASWHKGDELGFNSFGYVVYMYGGPVSFASKLLKVIALSSAEAEYAAASYTCKEIEFVRNVCSDLGFPLQSRVMLAVDNTAAVQIIENSGVTARTKHFQDSIHYVRQLYNLQRLAVKHVVTSLQRADGFTKPLEKRLFLQWAPCIVR